MVDKTMTIALLISFFIPGLGIAYIGDVKKALTILGVWVVCNILSFFSFYMSVVVFLIWAYGMYATYREASL